MTVETTPLLRSFWDLPKHKLFFIFGTGRGAGLLHSLWRQGEAPPLAGFIDLRPLPDLFDRPVLTCEDLARDWPCDTPVVLSNDWVVENLERLSAHGFRKVYNGLPMVKFLVREQEWLADIAALTNARLAHPWAVARPSPGAGTDKVLVCGNAAECLAEARRAGTSGGALLHPAHEGFFDLQRALVEDGLWGSFIALKTGLDDHHSLVMLKKAMGGGCVTRLSIPAADVALRDHPAVRPLLAPEAVVILR